MSRFVSCRAAPDSPARFTCAHCSKAGIRSLSGQQQREGVPARRFCDWACRKAHAAAQRRLASVVTRTVGRPLSPSERKASDRTRARLKAEAAHRLAGKVQVCVVCSVEWCFLYGRRGPGDLCDACRPGRIRAHRKAAKLLRKVAQRASEAENFDPADVIARDGWRCRLCDAETPAKLRGQVHPDAPVLDHRQPLAARGAHTKANCWCLCRTCNHEKADKWPYDGMTSRALRRMAYTDASLDDLVRAQFARMTAPCEGGGADAFFEPVRPETVAEPRI